MNFDCFRIWCMNKIINIIIVTCFLLFVILIIFIAGISKGFQTLPTNSKLATRIVDSKSRNTVEKNKIAKTIFANSNVLSTKKIGWGIKRNNNHEQPELGNSKTTIEKFGGIVIGDKKNPYIYLTFDVGYEGGYTNQILDVLKQNNVKAVFFITGQFLKTNPEIIKRMIEEGHIVGNHTVNHKTLPDCSDNIVQSEIINLHQSVFEQFNYEMKYLRPPKGEYSEKSLAYIQGLGYKTVMWSFAYDDWENDKQGREEYGKNKIIDNLHNGEIMLLHATSKDNANILDYVIKEANKMGYEFKSLEEFE